MATIFFVSVHFQEIFSLKSQNIPQQHYLPLKEKPLEK